MYKADTIIAVTTLLTQAETGYHLTATDIEKAEVAVEILQHLIIKAKQGAL